MTSQVPGPGHDIDVEGQNMTNFALLLRRLKPGTPAHDLVQSAIDTNQEDWQGKMEAIVRDLVESERAGLANREQR